MKFLSLLLLIATFAPPAVAGQKQPPIEIIKFSWRKLPPNKSASDKEAREKRNELIDYSIAAEYQQDHPDYGRIRALENMKTQGSPGDGPKASDKAYEYKFRLRNTGSAKIISLKFTYLFKDAATGNELVRHSFESKVSVRPGKQEELVFYTDKGPPMVVNAAAIKKGSWGWDETVIIEAVEYAGGSRWARQ